MGLFRSKHKISIILVLIVLIQSVLAVPFPDEHRGRLIKRQADDAAAAEVEDPVEEPVELEVEEDEDGGEESKETPPIPEPDADKSDAEEEDLQICGTEGSECKKLLIVLVDGLRPDYLTRDEKLKGFPAVAELGARAKFVKPVFPTLSYPNYYSIATGLYPENHGIVANVMYDPESKSIFGYGEPGYSAMQWWEGAEPIWILAKRRKVAMYWWPGCEVDVTTPIGRPASCKPYEDFGGSKTFEQEAIDGMEEIVEAFSKDQYSLAMVYLEGVDAAGHHYGPDAKETERAVRKVDGLIEELLSNIKNYSMEDKMNVIILSDHGQAEVEEDKIINLEEHGFDENNVQIIVGIGTFVMILPEENKEDLVYNQLREANVEGLNVYKRERLPPRYHLAKSENLLPIVLTADSGYAIMTPKNKAKSHPNYDASEIKGLHGYDPDYVEDMRAIMYAFGPAFKKNHEIDQMNQVDHYNLFCRLLNLEAKPNDGDLDNIEDLFRSESSEETDSSEEENAEKSTDSGEDGAAFVKPMPLMLIAITLTLFVSRFNCDNNYL